jgi:predicted deacylase
MLFRLLLGAVCLAGVLAADEIDHASTGAVDHSSSTLFILRDTSGAARKQLEKAGHRWERADGNELDKVEFVGEQHHGSMLKDMGFELIQEQRSTNFAAEGYNHPSAIYKKLKNLEAKNPHLAQVFSITKHVKHSKTVQGREIHAIKLSKNVKKDEDEPNFMLVSNHHARELVTPELALRTAQNLVKEYNKGDAKAKKILDNNQVYLLYTMNPDGLHSVWKGNVWQRKNARGVDLNRNYPVGWKMSCGGDTDPSSEGYRGNKPLSEVETQTMKKWQADRHFAKVMDVHSYGRDLRVNYGCRSLPRNIHQHQIKMAQKVAKTIGYPQAQSCCMGGDIHMAYQAHGSLAYLLELGGDGFQPPGNQREQVLKETYPGMKQFFGLPISLQGHVYMRKNKASNKKPKNSRRHDSAEELELIGEDDNAGKGTPVTASIAIEDEKFTMGEQSYTNPATGRYHLWAPPGKYNLRIKTLGDNAIEKKVQVKVHADGTFHDIFLDEATNMAESNDNTPAWEKDKAFGAKAGTFTETSFSAPRMGSRTYEKKCAEEADVANANYERALGQNNWETRE